MTVDKLKQNAISLDFNAKPKKIEFLVSYNSQGN